MGRRVQRRALRRGSKKGLFEKAPRRQKHAVSRVRPRWCALKCGGGGLSPLPKLGNGPNTVSGSTVSNTELSEFFGAH